MDGFVVVEVRCCWRGVVGCCATLIVCDSVEVEGSVVSLLFEVGEERELIFLEDIIMYVCRKYMKRKVIQT